jgi:hypothetical protein
MIIAMINKTIKMPTPIPVLKIPSTTVQPEKVVRIKIKNGAISVCFFMFLSI